MASKWPVVDASRSYRSYVAICARVLLYSQAIHSIYGILYVALEAIDPTGYVAICARVLRPRRPTSAGRPAAEVIPNKLQFSSAKLPLEVEIAVWEGGGSDFRF